jgi:hypothetical protein
MNELETPREFVPRENHVIAVRWRRDSNKIGTRLFTQGTSALKYANKLITVFHKDVRIFTMEGEWKEFSPGYRGGGRKI